jgi:hypothetical protein
MSPRAHAEGVSLRVSCRARGHNTTGRVHDLAREGCLLDLGNGFVGAGDTVALRFASGVRLNGRVTLLHGRIARVEFEQPLHEAIYEHLASSEGVRLAPVERCFTRSRRVASAARRLS